MKSLKYQGIEITPSQLQPWMVHVESITTHTLYGLSFYAAKINGCACSEGFDPPALDSLAPGAYVIGLKALPTDRTGLLLERGPVVDTQLPELTIQILNIKTTFKSLDEAVQNKFLLDKFTVVSLDIFVNLWRIMGAAVGRKIANKIVWERSYLGSTLTKSN